MNRWTPELEAQSEVEVAAIRRRMVAVHESMDDWARDFIAALKRVSPLCDCPVGSGEGAWAEVHDPGCVHHRWADVHDPAPVCVLGCPCTCGLCTADTHVGRDTRFFGKHRDNCPAWKES